MSFDHKAYIFHVNREDLCVKAFDSINVLNPVVIDNSRDGIQGVPKSSYVYRPSVPLTAIHSLNYALTDAKRSGAKICITMHEDAEAYPESATKLLELACSLSTEGRKWGVIFTNYDSLAAMNADTLDDVGLWDTFFSGYYGDNDWYRRLDLAGYEKIDSGIPVKHLGSQTIHSDPNLMFLNSITFPLYGKYYELKWGGSPGHETFCTPFNR